jgi:hypothetical protein
MGRVVNAARSVLIALLPLVLFVHAADPSTSGEALFERAVTAAEHGSYPRYATYAVDVSFTNGAHHVTDVWDTTEDITHSAVYASIFSRQEHASPFVPHGINLQIGGMVINAQRPNDPIGPVAFAADQDFGLRPPHAYAVLYDADTFATTASGFAVIGRSGTEGQRYAVTLVDADATSDHLALTPLRDPYHNRLRELWIDPKDASVQEAVVAGIGDRAPLDRVQWDVLFVQNAGGTYIAEEDALAPLDYGKSGHLQNARVTFDDLTLSSRFPFTTTLGIETPVQSQHDP